VVLLVLVVVIVVVVVFENLWISLSYLKTMP